MIIAPANQGTFKLKMQCAGAQGCMATCLLVLIFKNFFLCKDEFAHIHQELEDELQQQCESMQHTEDAVNEVIY